MVLTVTNTMSLFVCVCVGAIQCERLLVQPFCTERRRNTITSVRLSVGLPRCLGKASGFGLLLESERSAGRARGQLAGREILQLAPSKKAILEPQLG